MATPAQLQALLAARAARQPFWRTHKDDYVDDQKYSLMDGSRPVISIRIIANQVLGQAASAADGTVPVANMAHFRILLVVDESTGHPASVELNSMGMAVTGTTKLVVASRQWVHSAGTAAKLADEVILPLQGKVLTVDNILDMLIRNCRHHYRLHNSGSGCRYWTKVVLEDLVNVGFLPVGSERVVAAIMEHIRKTRPQIYMLANAQGQFF
ncbi:hypothetical protein V8D89_004413 [Ganoderma adspersum]